MEWNEPYSKIVPITITSPTRSISVAQRYHPGLGDLIVYYNGVIAVPGVDYNEISPWTIEFTFDLDVPDTLTLHYQKMW